MGTCAIPSSRFNHSQLTSPAKHRMPGELNCFSQFECPAKTKSACFTRCLVCSRSAIRHAQLAWRSHLLFTGVAARARPDAHPRTYGAGPGYCSGLRTLQSQPFRYPRARFNAPPRSNALRRGHTSGCFMFARGSGIKESQPPSRERWGELLVARDSEKIK